MKKLTISDRIALIVFGVFVIAALIVMLLADNHLKNIIHKSQDVMYAERLEAILRTLDANVKRLKSTGEIEIYEESVKESALSALREAHYTSTEQRIYPFVMNLERVFLMHPKYERHDFSIMSDIHMKQVLETGKVDFQYAHENEDKDWMLIRKYAEWDWLVGFHVPLEIRYADVKEFRKGFIQVSIITILLVLIILSLIIRRAMKPVLKLTEASGAMARGDLEHPIDTGGDDEVGVLASSFAHMRNEIKVTIDDLAKKNEELQSEISERKKAEALLLVKHIAIESSINAIALADLDAKITYVNPAFLRLWGYENDSEVLSFPAVQFWQDEAEAGHVVEALREHGGWIGEMVAKRKDGSFFVAQLSANLVTDVNGNPLCMMASFLDITDRKRSEGALLNVAKGVSSTVGHEFFNSLAEHLAKILKADYAYIAEIIEDKPNTVRTLSLIADGNFIDNIEVDLSGTPCETIMAKKSFSYITEIQKKFPNAFMMAKMNVEGYAGIPLSGAKGENLGLLAVMYREPPEDATMVESMLQIFAARASSELQRKNIEEKLKKSEERYRNIADNAYFGISTYDESGQCVVANQALADMIGATVEQVYSQNIHTIKSWRKSGMLDAAKQALEIGEKTSLTVNVVTSFGKDVWLDCNFVPYYEREEKYLLFLVEEITERKHMEEELFKGQKLESIGVLAGGIAHDFNNLLTAIMNNLHLIKMRSKSGEKIHERAAAAETASLRAQSLTHQLLTFSKGGAPIKGLVDIGPLVRESTSLALRGSNVGCEYHIADDIRHVEVDAGQINQVINNIVINADQSMPDGGIVKINCENTTLQKGNIYSLAEGDYIKVSIRDQGIGIPADHLARIFDPYFTTKQKGNGLGLSTTYSIIKKHEGYIGIESELGAGSVFTIYLPAAKEIMLSSEEPYEGSLTGQGKILIMDDEELVRDSLGQMLLEIGYTVGFAVDGREAVESYRAAMESGNPYDVVIMDLTIPGGMGGQEAVRELVKIDPGVKAIVSSGYSYDPVMANYTDYGFKAVLLKPYSDMYELNRIINEVIGDMD